ncbi:MAG TPA: outer membrane lipoprotein-sorting protein [Pseudobdellovibrionaceae bacterium]|nr:outer membrane lipoprotein-sorting protein [Pseudobdellovibrionaceae bacterium]
MRRCLSNEIASAKLKGMEKIPASSRAIRRSLLMALLGACLAGLSWLSGPEAMAVSKADRQRASKSAPSSSIDAEKLLARADQVRNPAESYVMRVQVKTDSSDQEFEVSLKGQDKTLIVAKKPASDIGRNMLMLDRQIFAYIPNLKRTTALSLQYKLSGQVANGDIARTRWSGDYTPTLESMDGDLAVMFLKGAKPNLTYQNLRLWVNAKNAHPDRAEFLGLDGKTLLKRARYTDYKSLAGALRPTRLEIQDPAGKTSTITIISMQAREFSDSLFAESNLERAR